MDQNTILKYLSTLDAMIPTHDSALDKALLELIDHIKILNTRWWSTNEKKIDFRFFTSLSERFSGKERLLMPSELMEVINTTSSLLKHTIDIREYKKFASQLPGQASKEMETLGVLMHVLQTVTGLGILLSTTPAGLLTLATLSLASGILGLVLCKKSGAYGLSKKASNVALAYEQSTREIPDASHYHQEKLHIGVANS